MALFPSHNKRRPNNKQRKNNDNPHRLPRHLTELDLLCHNTESHPLPVRMKLISKEVKSNRGEPMAVYACLFPGCHWREGWIADRYNRKKSYQLWRGFHPQAA